MICNGIHTDWCTDSCNTCQFHNIQGYACTLGVCKRCEWGEGEGEVGLCARLNLMIVIGCIWGGGGGAGGIKHGVYA